jgi:elongator complex protein 3
MLSYGFTRVEIGVQSLRDDVLRQSNRGHTTADSVRAFRAVRDSGLKVVCHMMPGLPGADPRMDLEDLRDLFEDEAFRPDMMKVYPTLVVRGTALARLYELGRYRPYDLETTVELLAAMKKYVPSWHRIMRIQREIPAAHIIAGVKNGNLRELVRETAAKNGVSCACIRCREVALSSPQDHSPDRLIFSSEEYTASGGTEVFASYEYERTKRIAGFVRMRWPSDKARREEIRESCVVRELKVYGRVVAVGDRDPRAWQHAGLGASMLSRMESMARERFGAKRLLVTSAVGTRNYYRRFGFERLGPYMSKTLK